MSNDNDQPTGADDALAIEVDNHGLMQSEVQRLQSERNQLASDYCDALKDIERLKARAYPHMCRDEHIEIGHADSENERCPLCREIAKSETLQAEVTRLAGENERLKANYDTLHEGARQMMNCTGDMWVCAFAEALVANGSLDDAYKAAASWAEDEERRGGTESQRLRIADLTTQLTASEADRNHAIASLVAASACLGDAGFKGETVREQVASVVVYIAEMMADNPEYDATDGAHPAWWRGQEYATAIFCQHVTEILDGKDDGAGANTEPWGMVRMRLIGLRQQLTQVKAERDTAIGQLQQARENSAEFIKGATLVRAELDKAFDEIISLRQEIKDAESYRDLWISRYNEKQTENLCLRQQCNKWKRRALLFQEAYKEKDVESFALNLQKLQLEGLGTDATLIKQRDSLKAKYLKVCRERNALRQQVREIGERVRHKVVDYLKKQAKVCEKQAERKSTTEGLWRDRQSLLLTTAEEIEKDMGFSLAPAIDLAACGAKAEGVGEGLRVACGSVWADGDFYDLMERMETILGGRHSSTADDEDGYKHTYRFELEKGIVEFHEERGALVYVQATTNDLLPAPPAEQEDEGNG